MTQRRIRKNIQSMKILIVEFISIIDTDINWIQSIRSIFQLSSLMFNSFIHSIPFRNKQEERKKEKKGLQRMLSFPFVLDYGSFSFFIIDWINTISFISYSTQAFPLAFLCVNETKIDPSIWRFTNSIDSLPKYILNVSASNNNIIWNSNVIWRNKKKKKLSVTLNESICHRREKKKGEKQLDSRHMIKDDKSANDLRNCYFCWLHPYGFNFSISPAQLSSVSLFD